MIFLFIKTNHIRPIRIQTGLWSHWQKFMTGYCALIWSTPISWSAEKQATVARSSTKAEYRALTAAASDVWLCRLLLQKTFGSLTYYKNSTFPRSHQHHYSVIIHICADPYKESCLSCLHRHIEIDGHFIKQCIQSNHIEVQHTASQVQLADLFTKYLPAQRFVLLRDKLMIKIDRQLEGWWIAAAHG